MRVDTGSRNFYANLDIRYDKGRDTTRIRGNKNSRRKCRSMNISRWNFLFGEREKGR